MNTKNWQGWRKEERLEAEIVLKAARKNSQGVSESTVKRRLRKSYLLRDLVVAALEKSNGEVSKEMVMQLNKALQGILNVKVNFSHMLAKSFRLWATDGGYKKVQAYITPKSILYTARGDY